MSDDIEGSKKLKKKRNLTYNLGSNCPSKYVTALESYEKGTYNKEPIKDINILRQKIFIIPFDTKWNFFFRGFQLMAISLCIIAYFLIGYTSSVLYYSNDISLFIVLLSVCFLVIFMIFLILDKIIGWYMFMMRSGFIAIGPLGIAMRVKPIKTKFSELEKVEFVKWEDVSDTFKVREIDMRDFEEIDPFEVKVHRMLCISFNSINHKNHKEETIFRYLYYHLLCKDEIPSLNHLLRLFKIHIRAKQNKLAERYDNLKIKSE